MSNLNQAIEQARVADTVWHGALVEAFGERRAIDARYGKAGQGAPGTELRVLHDWRMQCFEELNAAFRASRGETDAD